MPLNSPGGVGRGLLRLHHLSLFVAGSSGGGACGAAVAEVCEGLTGRPVISCTQDADRTFRRVSRLFVHHISLILSRFLLTFLLTYFLHHYYLINSSPLRGIVFGHPMYVMLL